MRRTLILLGIWLLIAAAGCVSLPGATPPPSPPIPNAGDNGQAPLPPIPSPIPQTPTPGPLTLVYWEEESGDGDVLLDELAAEFMQANPGIVVERAHYRYEELSLLFRTTALAGTGPDLVRAPGEFTEPFASMGIIDPVSKLYDAATVSRFLPGALEAATVNGALWGLPDNYGDSLVLLYNTDLVSEVPNNTDAWIAQLKNLTDSDAGRYGLVFDQTEPYWIVPWIGGFGGWPVDADGNPTLNTTAVTNALRFFQDLKFVHRVVPDATDYETAFNLFRTGQAAYIIDGRWNLDDYLGSGLSLGITSLPTVSATGQRPSPMAAGRHWFVSSQAAPDHRAAALRFADFMTSAHAQELWLTRMGRLPGNRETLELARHDANSLLAGAAGQLLHTRGLPPAQTMPCIWRAMAPLLEALMAGGARPEATADRMQSDAEACIQELADLVTPVAPP
jgi:arabinogalactan oligomer/maltooligosaccharide transport system substrate-binding protein